MQKESCDICIFLILNLQSLSELVIPILYVWSSGKEYIGIYNPWKSKVQVAFRFPIVGFYVKVILIAQMHVSGRSGGSQRHQNITSQDSMASISQKRILQVQECLIIKELLKVCLEQSEWPIQHTIQQRMIPVEFGYRTCPDEKLMDLVIHAAPLTLLRFQFSVAPVQRWGMSCSH